MLVVLGGPQASVTDMATMEAFPAIDFIVRGEAEHSFIHLIEALSQKEALGLENIRGITFRQGNKIVRTPDSDIIHDLDILPLPAYYLDPFIKEYKNGVGMRHLPFKKFMANWSYLLIGQLAYNFSLWIKHWALPGTWGRFSLKTLRFRLFHQPVKLVNIKRRPIIQLSIHYPWIREIKSSWQKIDELAA